MSTLQPPSQHGTHPNNDTFDLTIRFSASLPDLLFSIPTSLHATTSTLKQQIRSRLLPEYTNRRIRLIHAGKALADDALLSTSLKRPLSRPPSRTPTPAPYDSDGTPIKGKGKAPLRDPPLLSRIYIHCSIGDVELSTSDLAAEAALAQANEPGEDTTAPAQDAETTTPTPRGFDRLLTAGFSATEVQSLRLQFLAIQAHTHTPDTMPSAEELRIMEDRWLDNSNSATSGGMGGGLADDEGQAGALDDMIYGTAVGFFWPIGCLMWAVREDGIWSTRRKMAVVVGVVLNIALGLVRYTG